MIKCKDCSDRKLGCHGKCAYYQEYTRLLRQKYEANILRNALDGIEIARRKAVKYI